MLQKEVGLVGLKRTRRRFSKQQCKLSKAAQFSLKVHMKNILWKENLLLALLHSTTSDCRKPPMPKRFMAATRNTYSVPSESLVNLKQGLVTDSEMVVQPGRWASRCSTTYPLTLAPPSFSGGSQLTVTETPSTSSIFTGPIGILGLSEQKQQGSYLGRQFLSFLFLCLLIFL